MATNKVQPKKKKVVTEQDYDKFTEFCLNKKDDHGEPFYLLAGTQPVQNYRCNLSAAIVLEDFRRKHG